MDEEAAPARGHGLAGTVRVVDAGDTCRPNETAISWNQQGPAGPAGPQGDNGDKGDKGDKGDRGDTGEGLTAAPLAAGDPRCDGDGGLEVSTQGGTPLGVLCNGAPGAAGAKGDTGDTGATGPQGPAGPALEGSPARSPPAARARWR